MSIIYKKKRAIKKEKAKGVALAFSKIFAVRAFFAPLGSFHQEYIPFAFIY